MSQKLDHVPFFNGLRPYQKDHQELVLLTVTLAISWIHQQCLEHLFPRVSPPCSGVSPLGTVPGLLVMLSASPLWRWLPPGRALPKLPFSCSRYTDFRGRDMVFIHLSQV